MDRVTIFTKQGKETPFFWSRKDTKGPKAKTVFKRTTSGVKRMRGVHFDVENNKFEKEAS